MVLIFATHAMAGADHHIGIRLSDQAIQRLGIQTHKIATLPLKIPRSSLVFFQEDIGVYRLRKGWFKLVELKNFSPSPTGIHFIPTDSAEFKIGDHIVVSGAALLRVAELDAFGGGEEGHGH